MMTFKKVSFVLEGMVMVFLVLLLHSCAAVLMQEALTPKIASVLEKLVPFFPPDVQICKLILARAFHKVS